mmetsp:Transcript_25161/g.63837  ORF Transcript_25161/g.63837 Transcript_25161/m.63837 type:complete len:222 (-) Transcript_25161:1571-2236(-)
MAGQAPGQQEGFTHVLVGTSEELGDAGVHDTGNAVHEEHHLVLQHFRCIREVPDVAEAKDAVHSPSRDHHVQRSAIAALHVLANDLSTSLAETECQEGADLDDGLLQYCRLHRLRHVPVSRVHMGRQLVLPALHPLPQGVPRAPLGGQGHHRIRNLLPAVGCHLLKVTLVVAHRHGLQRVSPDFVQLRDHALNGRKHQLVGITREDQSSEAQEQAHEDGLR